MKAREWYLACTEHCIIFQLTVLVLQLSLAVLPAAAGSTKQLTGKVSDQLETKPELKGHKHNSKAASWQVLFSLMYHYEVQ